MRSKAQVRAREATLRQLARKLCKRPMTARTVAEVMGCAPATAYTWIRALPQLGYSLSTQRAAGASGPLATVYSVVAGAGAGEDR